MAGALLQSIIDRLHDRAFERRALISIVCFAFIVRVIFVALFPDQSSLLPDAETYRQAAKDFTSFQPVRTHHVMPGYPALIALMGPSGGLLVDILLSTLAVWCVGRIAREITGDPLSGLCAAFAWAINPFSLFYCSVGMTETMFVTLVLAGFLAFYRRDYWAGSIAMGAAILTRPMVELLIPVLIVAFVIVVHRATTKQTLQKLGIFVIVYVAMMSPWWAHNFAKYGEFVRLNLSDGYVLYSGNNTMNKSGGGIGNIDFTIKDFKHITDPVEQNRAMRQAAVRYIIDHPQRFAELAWLKFKRLWRLWPYSADFARPLYIFVSFMTMVPLLVFAVAGLGIQLRSAWRPVTPVIMFIGYMTAVHMVTIASVRYRFPMEPFLVILAAPALAWSVRYALLSRTAHSTATAVPAA